MALGTAREVLTFGVMKVDDKATLVAAARPAGQPFKKLLTEAKQEQRPVAVAPRIPPVVAKAPKVPGVSVAAQTKTVRQAAQVVQQARVSVEAEAQRIAHVRSGHAVQAQQAATARADYAEAVMQKVDDRVVDLICKELVSAFDEKPASGSRVANDQAHGGKSAAPRDVAQIAMDSSNSQQQRSAAISETTATPESKAEQAVALIEKIETFVKTQRPALALTLNNSLGARVEIERVGPREVALRLVGQNGPPSPEAVGRIRDEMRARGLKVAALSVA